MGGLLVVVAHIGKDDEDDEHEARHQNRVVGKRLQQRLPNHPGAPQDIDHRGDEENFHLHLLALQEHVHDARSDPADQEPGLKIEHGSPPPHQRRSHDHGNDLSRLFELSKHPPADPEEDNPGQEHDNAPTHNVLSRVDGGVPVPLRSARDVVLPGGHRLVVADHVHVRQFVFVASHHGSGSEQHREHQNEPSKQRLNLGHGDLELSLHRSGV